MAHHSAGMKIGHQFLDIVICKYFSHRDQKPSAQKAEGYRKHHSHRTGLQRALLLIHKNPSRSACRKISKSSENDGCIESA
jgi:hypothetical protein